MNLSACVMSIRTYLFLLAGIVFLLSFSSVKGQEKNEILIGAPISLSGDFALDGAEQKWAYEKAIAAENKNGGVFVKELNKKLMVKLIIEDDESD
ncbi:MAG: hypothetical protein JW795_16935, partial [Chitinivibrionales bacterium]|nr:hypothetical protein [Chitinivibrionales bacterium]